ncbi:hypothetical protein LTS18_009539, partial [Coniosporium uncinatum]
MAEPTLDAGDDEATEVAFLPLIPGVDIDNEKSLDCKVWKDCLVTLSEQDGFIKSFYGRQVENKDMLQWMIVWRDVAAHMAFTKSEAYQPFVKHISTLLSGPAYLHHVHFRTPFAAVASAPVTEMLTMYFKPTISYAQQEEAEKAVDELVAAAQRHASGFKGAASGWAVELIKHESLVNEIHEKGMAFLVALGWESVDAHMAFRETKEFKRYIEPLRDIAQ